MGIMGNKKSIKYKGIVFEVGQEFTIPKERNKDDTGFISAMEECLGKKGIIKNVRRYENSSNCYICVHDWWWKINDSFISKRKSEDRYTLICSI